MGHDTIRWNLSEDRALRVTHQALIQILRECALKYMPLKELTFVLNNRTRHHRIHSQNKHNNISKYLRIKYGSFLRFLETSDLYEVVKKNEKHYIYLKDESHFTAKELCEFHMHRITVDDEWVMIDEKNIS